MLHSLDPANKRIVLIGIQGTEDTRRAAIQQFMSSHSSFDYSIGHFYKGPRGNRTLSKVSYLELPSEDIRTQLLTRIGSAATINGAQVKFKKALTKVNAARNYSLRKAEELLKADSRCANLEVKASWVKPRGVTVGGSPVFEQGAEN